MAVMEARKVKGPFQRSKYPWEKWSDGQWYEMDCTGLDVSAVAFRSAVYVNAKARGLKAETSMDGEIVRFRLTEDQ